MIRKPNLAIMITMLLLLVLMLAFPAAVSASGTPDYSNARDITASIRIDEQYRQLTIVMYVAGSIAVLVLLALASVLIMSRSRLRKAKHEIETLNSLRETFMNAYSSMIYLKDENQKYVFINKAFESLVGRPASEIIGKSDYQIFSSEFADLRGQSDLAALKEKTVMVDEVQHNGKVYQTTKFPVTLNNGQTGLGAFKIGRAHV